MFTEILTGSGGILSYLQNILGGMILSSSTKKSGGGGFCPGGILSYTRLRSLTISAFNIRLTKDQELRQSGFKPQPLYHSHKVILCLSGNKTADTQS